jgi:hypothetical protein
MVLQDTYLDPVKGTVGQSDAEFKRLLLFENINFQEVLAGNDSSSGVPMVSREAIRASSSPVLDNLKSALYDTLMLSYLRGYTGEGASFTFDAELHRAAHCVIRLAIIIMADYCA